MLLHIEKALDGSPLGCRIVFGLSIAIFILFKLDHHLFVTLDLACRPVDVIYGLQVQRLLFASFVHTSLPGLCLALLVCWRRFACLERQAGTLTFLIWVIWASVLLHAVYCVVALLFTVILGPGSIAGEVRGLFPLLIANLVVGIRDTGATVWLWPLPYQVSVRAFPVIIIALSWLLHCESHLDVVVAYFVASTVPSFVAEPNADLADRLEKLAPGGFNWMHRLLQRFDCFVCSPASGSDLRAAGSVCSSGDYHEGADSSATLPESKGLAGAGGWEPWDAPPAPPLPTTVGRSRPTGLPMSATGGHTGGPHDCGDLEGGEFLGGSDDVAASAEDAPGSSVSMLPQAAAAELDVL